MAEKHDNHHRASASQYFVAGELCRRGYVAAVTTGNCPNTDILCSNKAGTKFIHIQVKTFKPGSRTCSLGARAEREYGKRFFWVLGGIPAPDTDGPFDYYVIPARIMAREIRREYEAWLATPGLKGQQHNATTMRAVSLPPYKNRVGWSIKKYRNRWDLIKAQLG